MSGVPHGQPIAEASYSAAELDPDDATVWILDQRRLPQEETYAPVRDVATMVDAIKEMWVRGAPAIGIAGAYGIVLAAREAARFEDFLGLAERLATARPTAVNLRWAVARMVRCAGGGRGGSQVDLVREMAREARLIHAEDVAANRRLSHLGAALLPERAVVLTHCNAGALATGGYGTALGVVRAAREQGKQIRVVADETRPWLQGARLTAWELSRDGFDVTVIADGVGASLMRRGQIDCVVVGADRVARSGDVANKIGTYHVACAARHHQVPFYVAAPFSTVDLDTPTGDAIVIEERPASEVAHCGSVVTVPAGVRVHNPSFDVTPAALVTALFTERGVVQPLSESGIARLAEVAGVETSH